MTARLPFPRPSVLEIAPDFPAQLAAGGVSRIRTPAGDPAWLLTRHADVKALFHDDRLGRSHPDPERAARFSHDAVVGGPFGDYDTEVADHAKLRKLMVPLFTTRRVERLRPRVQALLDKLLDDVAGRKPTVDLHACLTLPLPIQVICEFLGVPFADRAEFHVWVDGAGDMTDGPRAFECLQQLQGYMAGLVERKRAEPADDALSELASLDDGGVSPDELFLVTAILLFAGYETTVARLDFGITFLLTNPDALKAVLADPGLIPAAVEEILRISAPSTGVIPRYARADIAVGGETIRAGELVLLGFDQANQDPAVFAEPGQFTVTREVCPHLAFGHGRYGCVGSAVARLQLELVLRTVFARLPGLRLAVPVEALRIRDTALAGGLVELPVAWDPS